MLQFVEWCWVQPNEWPLGHEEYSILFLPLSPVHQESKLKVGEGGSDLSKILTSKKTKKNKNKKGVWLWLCITKKAPRFRRLFILKDMYLSPPCWDTAGRWEFYNTSRPVHIARHSDRAGLCSDRPGPSAGPCPRTDISPYVPLEMLGKNYCYLSLPMAITKSW